MTDEQPRPHLRLVDGEGGLDVAWRIVTRGAESGAYAGAVALVTSGAEIALSAATGFAVREPVEIPMSIDTIFDLASLTKVVATLPSVLRLIGEGAFSLETPIGELVPVFGTAGWKREVTVRRLLTHTGGLVGWKALFLEGEGAEAVLETIATTEPAASVGAEVIYSDLGFILLGEAVRAVSGLSIADYAEQEIFDPLDLRETAFVPPEAARRWIAATERGNAYEEEQAGAAAGTYPNWRQGMTWGEVHDGNSFYGMHGIAGHAGLFSSATDLARYGRLWLQHGAWEGRQLFPAALAREATTEQVPGRGLGWRVPPPEDDPSYPGHGLSAAAYGHTGFTGTSIWIDPARDMIAILLTNRVHPTVVEGIGEVRARFHEALAAAIPVKEGA